MLSLNTLNQQSRGCDCIWSFCSYCKILKVKSLFRGYGRYLLRLSLWTLSRSLLLRTRQWCLMSIRPRVLMGRRARRAVRRMRALRCLGLPRRMVMRRVVGPSCQGLSCRRPRATTWQAALAARPVHLLRRRCSKWARSRHGVLRAGVGAAANRAASVCVRARRHNARLSG